MYAPFISTLRLYAGWLLAWYFLIYAFGSYSELQELSFEIPYVEQLFLSPVILLFACGAYLFLVLTSLHRMLGGGFAKGLLCTVLGVMMFGLFWQYM